MMMHSEMVMRVTPLKKLAAPISAYTPGSMELNPTACITVPNSRPYAAPMMRRGTSRPPATAPPDAYMASAKKQTQKKSSVSMSNSLLLPRENRCRTVPVLVVNISVASALNCLSGHRNCTAFFIDDVSPTEQSMFWLGSDEPGHF